jgi:hypothetical protein
MAYTTIDDPTIYFDTKLYTGNGSTNNITGLNFAPDWVWLKERGGSGDHRLFDTVRGATNDLVTNTNDAEADSNTSLTAFNSDGFTLGNEGGVNNNSDSFVSWNWKGGTTSIPSGSTSDPSGVSYNATSGFGIYKITAPGSGNYVLKHGLGTTPDFIWVKDLDATQKHMIWVDQFSNLTDDYLQLNSDAAKATYSTCWGTMNTTDATIATGGTLDVNNDHIIYVFSNRQGFSKIGSYTGNGNADGTFVYTGFKPAFVILKRTDGSNDWILFDNKRLGYNGDNKRLYPNQNYVEDTTGFDLLSNGFKARMTGTTINGSSNNYIYMAFSESSFVNSKGVPNNAR